MHRMGLLMEAFPGALVVHSHRNPVESIASFASFIHTLHGIYSDSPDAEAVGRSWSEQMRAGLEHTMAVRDSPEYRDRFLDVAFADTVTDPMAVVRRIYDVIGWDIDSDTEKAMLAWLEADNAQHAQVSHRYTPEAFGLSAEGLRRDFAPYIARHIDGG